MKISKRVRTRKVFFTSYLIFLVLSGIIDSQLSRCSTARGSSSGFSLVRPAKVEALKSFLFSESYLVFKVKNT